MFVDIKILKIYLIKKATKFPTKIALFAFPLAFCHLENKRLISRQCHLVA